MALIHCNFFSNTLELSTSMYVVLPNPSDNEPNKLYPTLYLLHGSSDDHTIWLRRTSIERYATEAGIAVVMPEVHRSFYTDMAHGYKYFTFVSEEVPKIARSFFKLSDKREDNYVAGLSMGGYGAIKIGLSHPDKFYCAASLSGALHISNVDEELKNDNPELEELRNIFGTSIKNTENDLFYLAQNIKNQQTKPKIYLCCGKEDSLHESNLIFKNHIDTLGYDYLFEDGHGTHSWEYWDMKIQDVLKWIRKIR